MQLAVLGSLPAAEISAAWAAANAGTEVVYVTDHAHPRQWLAHVSWEGSIRSAHVKRVRVGSPLEADAFVLIASREETFDLVRSYAKVMRGRPILLAPGGFAIVEAVDKLVNSNTNERSAALGQLPGFPAIGEIESDNVRIGSVKRDFPVGPLQHEEGPVLLDVFRRWFPELSAASLAETTLSNTNNLIHPPILLVNAARSEKGETYLFYRQGVTDAASRLIHGIDQERLELLKALDQPPVPVTVWMRRYYGDQGLDGENIGQMLTGLRSLAGSRGPETLHHRYVSEDVAYGLAPMEELAHRFDVATPLMSSLIDLYSAMCGSNLREAAPRLVDQSAIVE